MTLPKFEDWKAPWEVDLKEGDEPEFDFTKGKQYLYNVLADKERLQGQVTTLTGERDGFKKQLDDKAREGESDMEKLTRERDEALESARKAGEKSVETLKLEVALDKGLTKAQAKRLVGNTKEELTADADEILSLLPGKTTPETDEGGDEGEPSTQPKARLRNPGEPNNGKVSAFDAGEAADAYMKRTGSLI